MFDVHDYRVRQHRRGGKGTRLRMYRMCSSQYQRYFARRSEWFVRVTLVCVCVCMLSWLSFSFFFRARPFWFCFLPSFFSAIPIVIVCFSCTRFSRAPIALLVLSLTRPRFSLSFDLSLDIFCLFVCFCHCVSLSLICFFLLFTFDSTRVSLSLSLARALSLSLLNTTQHYSSLCACTILLCPCAHMCIAAHEVESLLWRLQANPSFAHFLYIVLDCAELAFDVIVRIPFPLPSFLNSRLCSCVCVCVCVCVCGVFSCSLCLDVWLLGINCMYSCLVCYGCFLCSFMCSCACWFAFL
jgi:hypothetical protein